MKRSYQKEKTRERKNEGERARKGEFIYKVIYNRYFISAITFYVSVGSKYVKRGKDSASNFAN